MFFLSLHFYFDILNEFEVKIKISHLIFTSSLDTTLLMFAQDELILEQIQPRYPKETLLALAGTAVPRKEASAQ